MSIFHAITNPASMLECVFADDLFILRPRDILRCTYGYPYEGTSREALRVFSDSFTNATSIPQHIDTATHADLSFGGSPVLPTMLLGTIAIHNYVDPSVIEDIRAHNQARLHMLLESDDVLHTLEQPPVPSHWRLNNLTYLTRITHYRDQEVVSCLRDGFPQTGVIPSGNLFPPAKKPKLALGDKSSMIFSDKDASAISSYLRRTAPTDHEMKTAVIKDVLDECSKGRARGPFPLSTWRSHCKFCSPVFPIRQSDKIRLISNYSYRVNGGGLHGKSGYSFNDFSTTYHKVSMPRLAHVALASSLLGNSTKHLSRTDLEGAYRQVKMQPEDSLYSAGIFLSETLEPSIVIPLVLTFGAIGSVTNFLRVSELHAHLCRSLLFINAFSYLDDFFALGPPQLSKSACSGIEFIMEYCTGARIKHTKDIPPASSNLLLGLIIDLSHGGFFITLDESRRHRLISSLTDIKTGRAKISSKLAGKLTFAAEAFLGKAGRGFIRSLIRSSLGLHVPDAALVASIESLLYILHNPNIFTRNLVSELRLTPQRLICYADATGDGNLGFFSPPSAPHQAVYGFVNIAQHYTSSKPHINLLELLAGAIAVHTLSATTRPGTAFIMLFLDNTVAESLIYTGSSSSSQLNHAASLFWLNVANLPIYNVFISRVSSSLNPADSVSRHDFDQPWLEDAKSIPISLPQWTLDVL